MSDDLRAKGQGVGVNTVRVEWAGPVQAFALNALEAHAERVRELLPSCHYGPTYNRGVADNLSNYVGAIRKGEADSATYWLESAERCVRKVSA